MTAALWTGRRAWPVGACSICPRPGHRIARDAQPSASRRRFASKRNGASRSRCCVRRWPRACDVTAVVADAEYGDKRTLRQALHRARLPYALGISPTLTVFLGTPTLRIGRQQAPPRNRPQGWPDHDAVSVRVLSELLPQSIWRRVSWRNGPHYRLGGRLRRGPRHPGQRLAAPTVGVRSLAAVRTRPGRDRTPQVLPGRAARVGLVARAGPARPSALGHRTTLSGPQDRARARSFRRADLSGLAPPHGPQACCLAAGPPTSGGYKMRTPFAMRQLSLRTEVATRLARHFARLAKELLANPRSDWSSSVRLGIRPGLSLPREGGWKSTSPPRQAHRLRVLGRSCACTPIDRIS